jgi:hypothetical protein
MHAFLLWRYSAARVDAILVSNNNHLDNDDEVRRFGDSSKSSSSPPSSPSSHAYAASQGQGKAAAVASRGLLMHGIHSLVYRTLEHSSTLKYASDHIMSIITHHV